MALENKVIVITGANRGIGLEFVKQLSQRPGNTIIAGVRDPSKADHLKSYGPGIHITQLDVSDDASIESWAASLKEGFKHVDVVINNAGIYGSVPFGELDSESFLPIFKTNTFGPFLVIQALHKQGLIGGTGGHTLVSTISSTMGSIAEDSPNGITGEIGISAGGSYAYRASKTAVNSLMVALAHDLADEDITITLQCPGYVATDINAHTGVIDTETSVKGLLKVLEESKDLHGAFHYYNGKVIPW